MFVLPLSDARSEDRTLCGGKGASLATLIKAGFPVPDGFVVTTNAWEEFAETGAFQDAITTAIENELVLMRTDRVAVRSSASVEDGTTASWAGQFTTLLDVSKKDVVSRIYECMRSSGSAAARAYGARLGIESSAVPVAVVVQRMVYPTEAGVAFSVDPVSRDSKRIVIEAVHGSGSALVEGSTTPDSYVMEKKSETVVSASCGTQAARGILQPEKLRKLFELVIAIEHFYKTPQDIEWAAQGNDLFILQSRSITTL